MAGPDFRSLLSRPMDDIKKPLPLPAGTYIGRQIKYEFAESKEKKTPYVRFTFQLQSFGDDIDESQREGIDLSKRTGRRDFYLTEDAMFRLKDYIESCGVNTELRSLGECLPETANAEVLIEGNQKPNAEKPDEVFWEIRDVRGTAGSSD